MNKKIGVLEAYDYLIIDIAMRNLEYYGYNVEDLKREDGEVDVKRYDIRFDQLIWCQTCRKFSPSRFKPSPDAGDFWRCSECGDICGNIERLNNDY